MAGWAQVAVVTYATMTIVNGLVVWATAKSWSDYFHALRLQFDHLGSPQYANAANPPLWGYLLVPFVLGAQILFLIWQYRSATTARRLGFPAVRSPGWGVGSYFVPVVQLWMPYGALRDCLPPGHPQRLSILYAWIALVVGAGVAGVLPVALPFDRPIGLTLLLVELAAEIAVAILGTRMVRTIGVAHATAVVAANGGIQSGPVFP
jgi:hypothetical protein